MLLNRVRQAFIGGLKSAASVRKYPLSNLKIGIFKHDGLGDFILAIGAIRRLCDAYGEHECALFVSHLVTDFAKQLFPRATIIEIPWPRSAGLLSGLLWSLVKGRKIFTEHAFQKLICLRYQRSLYHELALSRIVAQETFGTVNDTQQIPPGDVEKSKFHFTHTLEYPTTSPPGACLELEAHRRMLSAVLHREVSIEEVIPRLEIPAGPDDDFILVSPFGSYAIKSYPAEMFIEALGRIASQTGRKIYVCASPRDRLALQRFCAAAVAKGIPNVVAKSPATFGEFCALIASAKAVITVDTSTAHVATAMDKPTVVLLGGAHYGIFGPWARSKRQIWLTRELPCFGCNWQCIYPEARCITEIEPKQIVGAALRVLGPSSQ